MTENAEKQVTAAQDLIAGGIAGSCSVIVGHPFDTYKVMLQTSSKSVNMRSLSISGLFRGLLPPLTSAGLVNALVFSSFGESSRLWDNYFSQENDLSVSNNDTTDLSSWQKSFLCGCFAGAVQTIVICPTEHVKCRLQVQHTRMGQNQALYKGPFDAFDKILNTHGIRGLYRGFICTSWREVPAFGIYFASYDYMKASVTNILSPTGDQQGDNGGMDMRTWAASSLAGGFSGALTWAVLYPFDVIKTKIQTLPIDTPLEKEG